MKPIAVSTVLALLGLVFLRLAHPSGILLYQGVAAGAVAAAGLFIFQRGWNDCSFSEVLRDSLLVFCLVYSFVFTVPTTVDRSYSIRLVDAMADAPNGMDRNEINAFYVGYFLNKGGVDRRIREQISTGTIEEKDGRYVLTQTGRWLNATFHAAAKLFSCSF